MRNTAGQVWKSTTLTITSLAEIMISIQSQLMVGLSKLKFACNISFMEYNLTE